MKNISGIIFLFIMAAANAQQMSVSGGTLKHYEKFESKFVEARNVDVWLPDGYSTKEKYTVLYMHDGQMLFDANTTWNKQEWRVDETAGKLIKEGKTLKFIVVGISSIPEFRRGDYFPQNPFESLTKDEQDLLIKASTTGTKVNSDNYLKFIVTELKPFIDKTFSTKKDRANTMIAGSSMGGLISLYAICEYPEVFGSAACISTHWPGVLQTENHNPIPDALMDYISKNLPSPKNHKIYFDFGTATLDAVYEPHQIKVDSIMETRGWTGENWITKKFPGADHSEKSWAERLDIPLLFLLGN